MALVDGTGAVVALCTWDAKGDVVGIPIDLADVGGPQPAGQRRPARPALDRRERT